MAQGAKFAYLSVFLFGLVEIVRCGNQLVTCGSVIKLQHVNTKYLLHSHEVSYGRGSQQQSVTAYKDGDDANSYWLIQDAEGACVPGSKIKKNAKLRLKHTATRRWLHSHQFKSPLSNHQEVSAYGSDQETDGGDVWVIEWDTKGKSWKQDFKVRLKHLDTGAFLHSHDIKYGDPIAGQQEVCAVTRKDKNSEWQAADGIYFPPPGKAESGKDEL